MDTINYFLLGILVFVLFGLVGLIIVEFKKPTPNKVTCPPNSPFLFQGQCFSCDPTTAACLTCPDTPCQNGGTCSIVTGGKGVCTCPDSYFGANCEKECLINSDCANNGQCLNGKCNTCVGANCQSPNCNLSAGCTCADGWVTDPNDKTGKKCGICASNRGPPGNCKWFHR